MKPRDRTTFCVALMFAVLAPGCGGSVELDLPADTKQSIDRFTDEISNVAASIAFSPDGQFLFVGTGFWNAKVRSWDLASGKLLHEVEVEEKVDNFRLDNGSLVLSIAPAIDSSTIAFGGRFTKRLNFVTWDGASKGATEVAGVPAPVSVASGLHPGEFFCGMANGEVTSVDVSTRRVTPVGKMRSEIAKLFSVPTARLLFAASEQVELAVWNVESGDQIDTVQLDDSVAGIDVTRDGRRIAVATKLGNLIIYEFDGHKLRLHSRHEFGDSLVGVAWSHDTSLIAAVIQVGRESGGKPRSADDEKTDDDAAGRHILRVWNTNTWTEARTDLVDEDVVVAVFSPVELVLAVVIESAGPMVVDAQTGQVRRLDLVQRVNAPKPDDAP
jgi:WD40 repeat protein